MSTSDIDPLCPFANRTFSSPLANIHNSKIDDIPRGNTQSHEGARRRKSSREDLGRISKQPQKLLHTSK
jgi:hypothetical protein